MGGQILDWAILIGIGLAGVAVAFLMWYFFISRLKYSFPVTIFSIRKDGSQIVSSDLGAFQKKRGEECFVLKNKKAYLPPPPLDYGIITEKGNTHFYVLQTGVNEFRYVLPSFVNYSHLVLTPDERDILAWNVYAQELMKDMFDMKAWLKKIAPYMILALAIGAVIVVMGIISKNLSAAIELGNTVVEKAAALGAATIPQQGSPVPF